MDDEERCTDGFCPHSHDKAVSCYKLWCSEGHTEGYFDALKLSRQELAKRFAYAPHEEEQSWKTVGLESFLRCDAVDQEDFAAWARRGRENLWLIYRQKPEVYAEVPDESGGEMLEVLFSVTQANWESVRETLDEANLRLLSVLGLRLLENALLVDDHKPDVEGRSAAPLKGLHRIATELQRRRVCDSSVGQTEEAKTE